MPCSWFGTTFEGACGYGAVLFTGTVGTIATLILAGITTSRYWQKRQPPAVTAGRR